ncbi:tRNA wybutosine-synthesizing protein 5-like isoform X2 [Montipora capricornis]|uniref:tRNA wybutosine-synthesizing protein 5-like isoform X2 n=1 Tax=Montipora capricornis TaxID=246305 RepID=UPI0035F1B0C0
MVDAWYNRLFMLHVFSVFTLFAGMNPASFEGLDEYSFSDISTKVNHCCILVALLPAEDSSLVTVLLELSQAFEDEKRVKVGVLQRTDLKLVVWKNNTTRDLREDADLAFYHRKKVDRTCLLRPSWEKPSIAERYVGPRTTEELLKFLNSNCATFRQLDGSLSPAGIKREKILQNLYRVPNILDTSYDSGPVNIATTCERIRLPSKDKFFQEYYLMSKPVVITGKLTSVVLSPKTIKTCMHLLPELEQDIKEMPFIFGELKRRHLNIWLSNGNTLGKLHFDPFDNFLCQISGKKQLFIYEPHENTRLYEAHIQEASLAYNPVTKKFRNQKLLQSTSMVMSPVNILKPDYTRFPKFKEARALNCTINEGDVLFMPSYWWHEVQSYPSKKEARNLAVNFWYEPFFTKEFPCATCKMDTNSYYHHML